MIDELMIPDWDEVLKHCKIMQPTDNTEFTLNVSGMTFGALAQALYYLGACIEAGVAGAKTVRFKGKAPFLNASFNWHSKFEWEDDYAECDIAGGTLMLSSTFDGKYTEIELNPRLCEAGEKTITEFLTGGWE